MESLRIILDKFNRNDIDYFLAAGTLLGIIREGKLLEHDEDVDVCVLNKDREKVVGLLGSLEKYYPVYFYYQNNLFEIFLKPFSNDLRTIDIRFLRQTSNFLWSPAINNPMRKDSSEGSKSLKSFIFSKSKKIYDALRSVTGKSMAVKLPYWPWSSIYSVKTIEIPIKLILPIREYFITYHSEKIKSSVPKYYEDYLNHRFGNWKKDNKDWNWWEDTGGLKNVSPEEYFNREKESN